ncbi:MAG: hypothetical protein H6R13_3205 [Proteobacteria bacterium]|nr:hypothetical protein [Pseudomonadota bacterium]
MVPSPCINVCQMDANSGLCLGCFRTIGEITDWSRLDDTAKTDILATVASRRQESDPNEGELRCNGNRND